MRKISLLSDVSVWTLENGPTPVKELTKPHTVYSPYGKPSKIWATPNGPEELVLIHLDTGQKLGFGASHEFMARDLKSPQMKPIGVRGLAADKEMCLLPMPTRKAFLYPDKERREYVHDQLTMSIDNYEEDAVPKDAKSLIFLNIDSVDDLMDKASWAGFMGMLVRLRPADQIIELDAGRPSCFAMKMLINEGVDDMVNALIDKHVLKPAMPYDQFLAMAKKTGCLFEGYGVADLRTILGVMPTKQEEETWTIHSDDPNTTIELAFMRT